MGHASAASIAEVIQLVEAQQELPVVSESCWSCSTARADSAMIRADAAVGEVCDVVRVQMQLREECGSADLAVGEVCLGENAAVHV